MNLEGYQRAYNEYFNLARKIAMDILDDYYLAGDVAQEVFTMMFLKRNDLSEDKIKFWIVLNTHRRAKDVKRKPYYRREISVDIKGMGKFPGMIYAESQPEEVALRQEKSYFRKAALDKLRSHNEEWYDILVRYHIEGETYPSLARRFGKGTASIRVEASRARKWLDKKVIEMYDG